MSIGIFQIVIVLHPHTSAQQCQQLFITESCLTPSLSSFHILHRKVHDAYLDQVIPGSTTAPILFSPWADSRLHRIHQPSYYHELAFTKISPWTSESMHKSSSIRLLFTTQTPPRNTRQNGSASSPDMSPPSPHPPSLQGHTQTPPAVIQTQRQTQPLSQS